jgi:hypothetical protein
MCSNLQGDRTSLWKNRPKCISTHFLSNFNTQLKYIKSSPKIGLPTSLCNFQELPKENNRPTGKNWANLGPILRLLNLQLQLQRCGRLERFCLGEEIIITLGKNALAY